MLHLRHTPVMLSTLLLVPMACRSTSKNTTKDVVPFNVGEIEPVLGQGYDSLVQELRQTVNCITGSPAKVATTGSQINMGQNVSSESVLREFSGDVKGTARAAFVDVGAAAGFYRSIDRSKSAWNLVYAVRVDAGSEQLRSVSLIDSAKTLAPSALLQNCGDEYVMQINRGGLLSITLSLDFSNEESRLKWQSQLKLNGSWPEVAKDLTKKIENKAMDGTLTIKVNQLGGMPTQSLLAVRSCPLSTLEEFNTCKQRVDELMTYASNAFPQQIDSNPAILNYVTAPLRSLGVSGLPKLSEDVLKIRSELEILRQESLGFEAALGKAKENNLEVDSSLMAAVSSNRDLIKQTAKACFTYVNDTSGPDFSACQSQYKQFKAKFKSIEKPAIDVNELTVSADSEVGNSIVNGTTNKMVIAYSVVGGRNWNYGIRDGVGVDGISTAAAKGEISSTALSPGEKLGTLLLRSEQNYSPASNSGRVEVGPGESISFVMNDSLGGYSDNTGVQQIFWRCISCKNQDPQRMTYRLRLRASNKEGASFLNRESQSGIFQVFAYGKWKSGRFASFSDARGNDKSCGSSCPLAGESSQALVMQQGREPVQVVGNKANINIKPKVPAYFLMNDGSGGYDDNLGEVEIILQCLKCDLKSHTLILDPDEV